MIAALEERTGDYGNGWVKLETNLIIYISQHSLNMVEVDTDI